MKKTKIPIIYEDEFVFAVNKPARVMSVPADHDPRSRERPQKSVVEIVQDQYEGKGRPFLLHRLDMNTSGVLLFGRDGRNRRVLEGIFKDQRTKKVYMALLKGVPRAGVIQHKLEGRYKGEVDDVEKVPSITEFKIVKVVKALGRHVCALTEVNILTGRKHQIRQHFANIGFPVIMDDKYGDKSFNRRFRLEYWLGRQFLHAQRVEFFHPLLEKTVVIEAPLAPDLKLTLERIVSNKNVRFAGRRR